MPNESYPRFCRLSKLCNKSGMLLLLLLLLEYLHKTTDTPHIVINIHYNINFIYNRNIFNLKRIITQNNYINLFYMNPSIYTSAYYSLVIQFIIAIICLLGTFIKLDVPDKILHEVLVLETVVQFIEFSFYVWLIYNFNNIKIDISVVRYYDWFLTTPTMLFAVICFMVYFHKKTEFNSTTEEMSLENIYHENSNIINKILASNAIMLLLGYLGELNIISKVSGFMGGTFFLLYAFYYLYVTFVKNQSINKYLFWFNFILWSGYGIAYLLSHENKNNMYNILDVFAKNINGLFILLFIVFKYCV